MYESNVIYVGSAHQDALILSAISALGRARVPTSTVYSNRCCSWDDSSFHFKAPYSQHISIWTIYSEIKIILCKSNKQLINLLIQYSISIIHRQNRVVGVSASATDRESSLHYCGGACWLLFIHMERHIGEEVLYFTK